MKRFAAIGLATFFSLVGCTVQSPAVPMGMPAGMGMGSGMLTRHGATIPEEFVRLSSPILADEQSLERGAILYAAQCAVCHGDGGMGDGPTAASLDPAPAPIAHTSQMLGDDYLFWRISQGGVPFNTAMPAFEGTLDEQDRWDVINYVRALGRGQVQPASAMGGAMFDPAIEATQRAEMLVEAVEQNLITQAEADTFGAVHDALDEYPAVNPSTLDGNSLAERQAAMLDELVVSGAITQAQSDSFLDIHDRLIEAGLME